MQHIVDYLNGYLDCVERLLALRLPQLENGYATLSHFPIDQARPSTEDLLNWARQTLQQKHAQLSLQHRPDAKYYYVNKPRHWAEALQRTQLQAIDHHTLQQAIAQFFATGTPLPHHASPALADTLSTGFVDLLQKRLLQHQYADCQFFELLHTPFPLSSHYSDAVDASREFLFLAPHAQQPSAIYYLALGLREEWSM